MEDILVTSSEVVFDRAHARSDKGRWHASTPIDNDRAAGIFVCRGGRSRKIFDQNAVAHGRLPVVEKQKRQLILVDDLWDWLERDRITRSNGNGATPPPPEVPVPPPARAVPPRRRGDRRNQLEEDDTEIGRPSRIGARPSLTTELSALALGLQEMPKTQHYAAPVGASAAIAAASAGELSDSPRIDKLSEQCFQISGAFCARVRARRKAAGLTRAQIGQALAIKPATYEGYETRTCCRIIWSWFLRR